MVTGSTKLTLMVIAVAVITISIMMIILSPYILVLPSEETCQSYNPGGFREYGNATKYWCEQNETGWHYNRTKMKDDLGSKLLV